MSSIDERKKNGSSIRKICYRCIVIELTEVNETLTRFLEIEIPRDKEIFV